MDPAAPETGPATPEAPLLSACLIVRDEEPRLPACLASLGRLADEIVVGDTGSRDRSAAVARRHGARVVDVPWTDDFAAARNAVLDAARGRWVLFLDADERLAPHDAGAVRRSLGAEHAEDAFTIEVHSPRGPSDPEEVAHLVRLFRRAPHVRYEGRIHETVLGAICRARGVDSWLPPRSGLVVQHEGYRPELQAERGKRERNRRLLRAAIDDAPGDPGPRFLFGRENVARIDGDLLDVPLSREALGVLAPAADALLDALRDAPARGITEPAVALAASLALATGDVARARAWAERAKPLGRTRRLVFLEGELLLAEALADTTGFAGPEKSALLRAAAITFEATREAAEGSPALPTEGVHFDAWAHQRATLCRVLAGDVRPGPQVGKSFALIGALERTIAGDAAGALGLLMPAISGVNHDPRIWLALSVLMKIAGDAARAAALLESALRLAPEWEPAAALQRGDSPRPVYGLIAPWLALLR